MMRFAPAPRDDDDDAPPPPARDPDGPVEFLTMFCAIYGVRPEWLLADPDAPAEPPP